MDPFTLGLIGAGIGALSSKNKLKGALMGGMGGYAGGAMMPGLLGTSSAAASSASPSLLGAAEVAAPEFGAALPAPGLYGAGPVPIGEGLGFGTSGMATPGLEGSGFLDKLGDFGSAAADKLKAANTAFKPVGQAMSSAKMASSLFPDAPPLEAPAPQFGGGGNPQFQAIEQQQLALEQQRLQEEMQRRQAQQKLLSMIGGSYGRTA